MASLKERLFDALEKVGIPVAYNDSNINQLPRINYSLIVHYSVRLSNMKHKRITRYQVDLFSDVARDVESDDLLLDIERRLVEVNIKTSDWREVSSIDVESDLGIYHYYLEAWS